jgi:phosphoribosylglycinamide formyltransferase-1
MKEQFVSELITAAAGTGDTSGMARGEPGLPRRFTWRDREYAVCEIIETWKQTSPCSHGSGENYVRKHWYRIRTECGSEMRIYFERQAGSAGGIKKRWWLYSVSVEMSE